jgi:hypothetical protein
MLSFGSLALVVGTLLGTIWWVSRGETSGPDS